MSALSGLGVLDLAILEACERAGARSGAAYVKTQRVLEVLADSTGIGPRHAYEPLCDMARSWVVHLPLIDFHGNVGSPDFTPASPRYTECRLTPLGAGALAAERGTIGPLPVGLINGTTHTGGTQPPLDPTKVVRSIREAWTATDVELAAIVGLPSFPTGCAVDGDLPTFAAGDPTELRLSVHIAESSENRLVISNLPPDIAPGDIANRIHTRLHPLAHPTIDTALAQETSSSPIIDINISSTIETDTQLVVTVAAGRLSEARSLIDDIWGIHRTTSVHLRQPLANLIRHFGQQPTADLQQRLSLIESSLTS